MFFFLLLIIPAAILCILSSDAKYDRKKLFFPSFLGFSIGLVTTVFRDFFLNPDYFPVNSFPEIFLHLAKSTVFPMAAITAVTFLFSKDEIKYKAYSLLPSLGFFYSIFIPYITFTQLEKTSFFVLFINPVVYIETILLFCSLIKIFTARLKDNNRGKAAISAIASVAAMAIQPVIFTMWYLKIFSVLWIILAIILAPLSVLLWKFTNSEEF